MKNIFIAVIEKGGYDLEDMLKKIDSYHIEGKITAEERAELYEKARKNTVNQYDYKVEIEKLWEAVRSLAKEETDGEEYASFAQPTGAHDAYNKGDKVIYNGNKYVCVIDNCVWSPDVYPVGWQAA